MFKLVGLLFLVTLSLIQGQILLSPGIHLPVSHSVPSSNLNLTLEYERIEAGLIQTTFIVYPCFGNFNWYMEIGVPPSLNNPRCSSLFEILASAGKCDVVGDTGALYYLTALAQANGNNPAAKFDVGIYNTNTNEAQYNALVPVPGNGGVTENSLSNERSNPTLTMIWTGTGHVNDTYSVWKYSGEIPSPVIFWTACGVKESFEEVNLNIEEVSSNRYRAVIPMSGIKERFTAVILVERPGGYMATYSSLEVNGTPLLSPLTLLVFLFTLLSLFH